MVLLVLVPLATVVPPVVPLAVPLVCGGNQKGGSELSTVIVLSVKCVFYSVAH